MVDIVEEPVKPNDILIQVVDEEIPAPPPGISGEPAYQEPLWRDVGEGL